MNLPRNTTNYNVAGTNTFRLSSRKILRKYGSNLQNIEKEARKIYIPDDSKIFVQTDQRGAEALIVAYLCRHGNFRDLFLNHIKSHVFVGLHVFKNVWKEEVKNFGSDIIPDIELLCGLKIQEITSYTLWKYVDKLIKSSDNWPAEKRYYYISKQICHASNYGMKAGMFQLNTLEKSKGKIVISKKDAEMYLEVYHSLFPEIHEWHREVERQLNEVHTLYNLFGFPRYFWYPEQYAPDRVLKEAYAFVPQSTVGSITNIALTRIQKYIEEHGLNWDVLANTHDSYLLQVPIGEEHEAKRVMQEFMNIEMRAPRGEMFKMESDTVAGMNWAPVKPLPKDKQLDLNDPEVIEKFNLMGLKEI